jgi:hypothetical protein
MRNLANDEQLTRQEAMALEAAEHAVLATSYAEELNAARGRLVERLQKENDAYKVALSRLEVATEAKDRMFLECIENCVAVLTKDHLLKETAPLVEVTEAIRRRTERARRVDRGQLFTADEAASLTEAFNRIAGETATLVRTWDQSSRKAAVDAAVARSQFDHAERERVAAERLIKATALRPAAGVQEEIQKLVALRRTIEASYAELEKSVRTTLESVVRATDDDAYRAHTYGSNQFNGRFHSANDPDSPALMSAVLRSRADFNRLARTMQEQIAALQVEPSGVSPDAATVGRSVLPKRTREALAKMSGAEIVSLLDEWSADAELHERLAVLVEQRRHRHVARGDDALREAALALS